MFDIGFTELLVVGIVALIVVGPEKLPDTVRTLLTYIRKIKSSFNNIRDEVERELDLDGLKKNVTDTKDDLSKVIGYDELHDSLDDLRRESESLRDIAEDGFEYANNEHLIDDFIDDESHLVETSQKVPSRFDNADAEASTGVEAEMPSTVAHQSDNESQPATREKTEESSVS